MGGEDAASPRYIHTELMPIVKALVKPADAAILELVCASAAEVHDWHAKVVAAGYAVDGPPRQGARGGALLFFVTGPDGYRVEIVHFADPKAAGL